MRFGNTLKELRTEKRLSQSETAKLLGIAQSTYANYEIDNREPDFETLVKIADYFNVTIDYLFGRPDILQSIKLAEDKENKKETLNFHETKLLTTFRNLNVTGQAKVIDYAKDLDDSKKYMPEIEAEKIS